MLLSYFLLKLISDKLSNVYVFILVLIFDTFDFWTVKNITGAL